MNDTAIILAGANLALTGILIPAAIYLAKSLVREEIAVHDTRAHAHPNLISLERNAMKMDNLLEQYERGHVQVLERLARIEAIAQHEAGLQAHDRDERNS